MASASSTVATLMTDNYPILSGIPSISDLSPPPSAPSALALQQTRSSLPDEAPPAYSLAADTYSGETAIGFGPRRPFRATTLPRVALTERGSLQQTSSSENNHGSPPDSLPEPVTRCRAELETNSRPTSVPTSGRPLLNHGHVLVYESGFTCQKCLNTGYKQNDPVHPCKQCWKKYSIPYLGPLVSAHWDSSSGSSMQRPLQSLRPSQGPRSLSPSQYIISQGGDPKGVRPGDPRIGGRLCWRCDGVGTIRSFRFLSFDMQHLECPVCGGLGRNFYDLVCR